MWDQLPFFNKHKSLHFPLWDASKHTAFYCLLGGGGDVPFYFQPPHTFYFALPPLPPSFSGKCTLIYLVNETVLVVFAAHWLLWMYCIHLLGGWYHRALGQPHPSVWKLCERSYTAPVCVYFQQRYCHLENNIAHKPWVFYCLLYHAWFSTSIHHQTSLVH